MTTLLVLVLALAAPKSPAAKEAERLAKQSMVEYNVGDFDNALDDVTKAYKLDPVPGLLFNLAQCHRALHHWEKAEFFYRGYLREKPSASNRPAVEELIKDMVAKQREAPSPPPPAISATPPSSVTVTQSPLVAATPAPMVLTADNQRTSTEPTVEGRAQPTDHSRALSYSLMGVAGAGAVLTGVSGGFLIDYQSYRSGLASGASKATANGSYATFESKSNTASIFNVLLYVGIGVFVGGLGGAVLTW